MEETTGEIVLRDNRRASLERTVESASLGKIHRCTLTEPTSGGVFRTSVSVGLHDGTIALWCDLEGGQARGVIAPAWFDVFLPRFVGEIVGLNLDWHCGADRVRGVPRPCRGREDGKELAEFLSSSSRTIPVVVVSDFDGLVLHPGIADRLARDLVGLAQVVALNGQASWSLTEELGQELSCFHGAIRLYWPRPLKPELTRAHPLWTSTRLLLGRSSTQEAERAIRSTLRRQVFSASAFALQPHALFKKIEHEVRHEAIENVRSSGDQELEAFFNELADKVEALEEENDRLRVDRTNLRAQLNEALMGRLARAATDDEIEPDEESPPDTITEAVNRAKERWSEHLLFGGDVERGIGSVDTDAGPPDKVLRHLEELGRMAAELSKGALGKAYGGWLAERGVVASPEDASMMNNRREQQKRTWADGSEKRIYTWHTKPSDGTAPSRCVRIYFDWDEESSKVIIGWVGRHPK